MKKLFVLPFLFITSVLVSQNAEVLSPDGKLKLNVLMEDGKAVYTVKYSGNVMLENSPLGLKTNEGDF